MKTVTKREIYIVKIIFIKNDCYQWPTSHTVRTDIERLQSSVFPLSVLPILRSNQQGVVCACCEQWRPAVYVSSSGMLCGNLPLFYNVLLCSKWPCQIVFNHFHGGCKQPAGSPSMAVRNLTFELSWLLPRKHLSHPVVTIICGGFCIGNISHGNMQALEKYQHEFLSSGVMCTSFSICPEQNPKQFTLCYYPNNFFTLMKDQDQEAD